MAFNGQSFNGEYKSTRIWRSFFDGDEADNISLSGLRIIDHQLDEQILSDGGHFELSPPCYYIRRLAGPNIYSKALQTSYSYRPV